MKKVDSLNGLKTFLSANQNVWLLLYKKGSGQSDCAFENYSAASGQVTTGVLLYADVNHVRDIHPEYNISSVPALLHFKSGKMVNQIKGCYTSRQFKAIFENAVFVATNRDKSKPVKRVTVYTTPACSWCTTVKRHLDAHRVAYREIDVSADQRAAEEMVRKSGRQGVPQLDINGQVIVGFDRDRINSLLEIN